MAIGSSQSPLTLPTVSFKPFLMSDRASSFLGWLVTAPISAFFAGVVVSGVPSYSLVEVITVSIGSPLVLGLGLWVFNFLVSSKLIPKSFRLTATFFLAAAFLHIVQGIYLNFPLWPTEVGELNLITNLTVGSAVICAWLMLGNYLIFALNQRRLILQDIAAAAEQLSKLRSTTAGYLEEQINRLKTEAENRIRNTFERLEQQISGLGEGVGQSSLADQVQQVRQSVRDFSHELENPQLSTPPLPERESNFRPRFSQLVNFDSQIKGYVPWIIGLASLSASNLALQRGGVDLWAASMLAILVAWASYLLISWLRKVLVPETGGLSQFLGAIVDILLISLLSLWAITSIKTDLPGANLLAQDVVVAIPITLLTMWFLVYLAASVNSSFSSSLSALEDYRQELRRELDSIEIKLRLANKRMALLLHGPIQGRLASVALVLSTPCRDQELRQALSSASKQLSLALQDLVELAGDGESTTLRSALGRIESGWSGLIELKIETVGELDSPVLNRTGLVDALVQAINEAISNAIRHGSALKATVRIQLTPEELKLLVSNVGNPPSTESTDGIGLQTIRQSGANLELRSTTNGTELEAIWKL